MSNGYWAGDRSLKSSNEQKPDDKSWFDSLTPEQIAKLSYWDVEEK